MRKFKSNLKNNKKVKIASDITKTGQITSTSLEKL